MGLGEEGRRNSIDKRTQFFKDGGTANAAENWKYLGVGQASAISAMHTAILFLSQP